MRNSAIAQHSAPGRIGLFLVALAALWAPLAIPIYVLGNRYDPNLASITALALLYIEFLVLLWQWRYRLYRDARPFKSCGLSRQKQDGLDLARGLGIGLAGIAILFGLAVIWGWAVLQPLPPAWPRLLLEGLLMALAVGFAEELLFRGWLLTELEQDYSPAIALWMSSLLFALAHYIRPLEAILQTWPQFFGLLVLGLLLGWAKRSRRNLHPHRNWTGGRLSLPIGLHAGLIWGYYCVDVADLVAYTGQVPAWVTGIDQNPLAGLMGLLLLGGMAWGMRSRKGGKGRGQEAKGKR